MSTAKNPYSHRFLWNGQSGDTPEPWLSVLYVAILAGRALANKSSISLKLSPLTAYLAIYQFSFQMNEFTILFF